MSCHVLGWLVFYHHGLRNEGGSVGFMMHVATLPIHENRTATRRFDCCQNRFKLLRNMFEPYNSKEWTKQGNSKEYYFLALLR